METLGKFNQTFPDDQILTTPFASFVADAPAGTLCDRRHIPGHITASAMIMDREGDHFLLLHHRKLDKWLQPGGHVESCDRSLLGAAMREVGEETGLDPSQYDVMSTAGGLCIIDLDSHPIPANATKGEPAHCHHDIRFLFRLNGEAGLRINAAEARGYMWASEVEFPEYFRPWRVFSRKHLYDRVVEGKKIDGLL